MSVIDRYFSIGFYDSINLTFPQANVADECYEFRRSRDIKYRTHLYYLDYEESLPDPYDVTWMAHLSLDRLPMLERLCQLWEGPISLALYLSDAESEELHTFVSQSYILSDRKNIGYHIVYKQEVK